MYNSENKRRFNGDPFLFDKISRIKTKQIIGCAIGVACIVGFFIFAGMQEEARTRDAYDFFKMIKILCIAFGALNIVMSPIVLYTAYKDEQKLSRSYIEVSDSGVSGVCFSHKSDITGHFFNVSYDDIVGANVISCPEAHDGNNMLIKTKSDNYYGYSIDNHVLAVRVIEQKRAEYQAKKRLEAEPKPEPEKPKNNQEVTDENNEHAEKYCFYCGTALPKAAKFCYSCGKNNAV